MLSSTSHIQVQVEQVHMDVLRWIGKHWIGIRHEGGFNDLEGWSIKEISDSEALYRNRFVPSSDVNSRVPVDDLIMPAPSVQKGPTTKTLRSAQKPMETVMQSVYSLCVSVCSAGTSQNAA
jgi:hypothetical protein